MATKQAAKKPSKPLSGKSVLVQEPVKRPVKKLAINTFQPRGITVTEKGVYFVTQSRCSLGLWVR